MEITTARTQDTLVEDFATGDAPERSGTPPWAAGLPVALVSLLLLFTTWFDGAFQTRHWAPLGLLTVAALATSRGRGDRAARSVAADGRGGIVGARRVVCGVGAVGRVGHARLGDRGAIALYAALLTIVLVCIHHPVTHSWSAGARSPVSPRWAWRR